MPVERRFHLSFNEESLPMWVCPTCGRESFQMIVQPGPLAYRVFSFEDLPMEKATLRDVDNSGVRTFQGWAACLSHGCRTFSSVSGTLWTDVELDLSTETYYEVTAFHVAHFSNPPWMIKRTWRFPEAAEEHLRRAEALVWGDPASAVVAIRKCIGSLLDDQQVPKKLSLSSRITRLDVALGNDLGLLQAARLIGNAGAHGESSIDQALNAFDFLELAYSRLYEKGTDQVRARAKRIVGDQS